MTMMLTHEECIRCGHPFDPHALVAVAFWGHGHDLPVAGYLVCPDPHCECVEVWSVDNPALPTFDIDPMTKTELVAEGMWPL